jgi:ribosomal protein S18 acetylase RimI-like enzyme
MAASPAALPTSLVVDPPARGHGLGRALTEECIRRAQRDEAPIIGLHTTPIMTVALPMYLRMGFNLHGEAPPICGVPYAIYTMALHRTDGLEDCTVHRDSPQS